MQFSLRVALKLFRAVGTPRALTCKMLVEAGEWSQLADLRVDPHCYLDARELFLDTMCTEFLRKLKGLPTGRNLRQAAIDSFWESERTCAKTNARLSSLMQYLNDAHDDAMLEFLQRVKRRVSNILGRVPDEVFPRFGPGSTYLDRYPYTTVLDKMSSYPTVTSSATCFLDLWKHTAWWRIAHSDPKRKGLIYVIRGDRFTTVPKDSTKDRGITIPPSINGFYQLGVGSAMRSRLKLVGIDLEQGQDVHRQVAQDASLTGEFATIDLKSASDTVSSELVKMLLPELWFELLNSLRCSHTRLRGKWVRLNKFSAMGNGYTFELETLIFLAISCEVMSMHGIEPLPGVNVFVYGDDIIVPSEVSSTVLAALEYCGFSANPKKTFVKGSFRESCGGDFFEGQPVRGYYHEEDPTHPHELIALANGIWALRSRLNRLDRVRRSLTAVWHYVLDSIPSDVRRCRGPESLGDLVIHDTKGWVVKQTDSRFEIRVWRPVTRPVALDHWRRDIVFAAALYGVTSEGALPRGSVSGYRRGWVALMEDPSGRSTLLRVTER